MSTEELFKCYKCGECCKRFSDQNGVLILPSDAENISTYLGVHIDSFYKQFCYKEYIETELGTIAVHFLKHRSGICLFLNQQDLCNIHNIKPIQCKKGPVGIFWNDKREDNYRCIEGIAASLRGYDTYNEDKDVLRGIFLQTNSLISKKEVL
jgi:Fe-S-cluster containining protein